MVTETRDTMNKAFDTFNDGFRSAVDASQRTQETWMNFVRDACRRPADMDRMLQRTERIVNEWMPFVGGTMNTMVKAYDTNLRAGMEVCKTYFDNMARGESTDLGKATRQIWDATFEAVRTNFDVMNRVSARTLENCAAFCEASFGNDNGTAKGHSQQPTRPTGKNEKTNGH